MVPQSQAREDTLSNALHSWAQRDPDALKAWLATRTDPRERTVGQVAYAHGLMQTDPAAAAASLLNLALDDRHSWTFSQVFSEFA
jgi:hypothetical protein